MPASNYDPISSVLKNSFKQNGEKRTVDDKMSSSLQKSMLVSVQFDDPIRHTPSATKSNYIMLPSSSVQKFASQNGQQTSNAQKNQNGQNGTTKQNTEPAKLDQVPPAKLTLYRREQIQLGHLKMGAAGAGMHNMGNTCYLNSTLQALFHIPALTNYLRTGGHDSECNMTGFSSCTICILASTLRQSLASNVIKPVKLYEKLKFICKHLVHGRQEDAHEFLRYLIESLQRCYLMSRKVPKTLDNYSKETTPFNQIFGGYMRQELHCFNCKHISTTFQHFMDLLLDIRHSDNIGTAMSGYFKKEILRDDTAYKCEKCKQKVSACKIYKIERPPLVLCIQLKRFNMMGGKNGRPVTLAKNLDMSQYVRWASSSGLNFKYRLVSLITHVGPSPNCGHYTAIGEAPNGTYYRFDDSSVHPTSVNNVLNTSAYVIFYEMTRESRDKYLQKTAATSSNKKSDTVIGPQLPSNSSSKAQHSPSLNRSGPTTPTPVVRSGPATPPVQAVKPLNRPTMISETNSRTNNLVKSNSSSKLGVVIKPKPSSSQPILPAKGLVPYDGDESSSDDDIPLAKSSTSNSSAASVQQQNGGNAATLVKPSAVKSPFLPRAVQLNPQLKKAKETATVAPTPKAKPAVSALSIYEETDLKVEAAGLVRERSSSGELTSSQERVGFSVNDKEAHNPSINSDNSTGSTHSFTVSDIRGVNGQQPARSNNGWNVAATNNRERSLPSTKRERSVPPVTAANDTVEKCDNGFASDSEALSSPLKRAKILNPTDKQKKPSVLDDMKTKTTETLREFGKDVLSAGLKMKQQLGMRSNKVTDKVSDKLFKMGKNLEDSVPRSEDSSSTSCLPSTSPGSLKAGPGGVDSELDGEAGIAGSEDDEASRSRKKHKKKKKKKKKKERDDDDEWEEKTKDNLEKFDKKKAEEDKLTAERMTSYDPAAPVKRWDSKPDIKQIGRSVTWDGSKGSNFLDEIKKIGQVRSWSGERKSDHQDVRKRSAESDEEMDRGRTKKVKKYRDERSFDYNPFQMAQNVKDRAPKYSNGDNRYDRDDRGHGHSQDRSGNWSRHDKGGRYHRDEHRGSSHDHRRGRQDSSRPRKSWDHNYHRERGHSGRR